MRHQENLFPEVLLLLTACLILFVHQSLGLSADHAGNELRRVNQEPPPDYILHACGKVPVQK